MTQSQQMSKAWEIARDRAVVLGGSPKDYISEGMKKAAQLNKIYEVINSKHSRSPESLVKSTKTIALRLTAYEFDLLTALAESELFDSKTDVLRTFLYEVEQALLEEG